ncbi:GNAT family N-acetyltransferase [Sporosarcina thermotolerans]|uniref:GNAT family N-acetyltransferase n=1 Tax=Sporosarcina thermotolerans TaxID=633404 RepID=A0AAW9A3W2_9BACL|nr:GNAT family N-acetyltransferase [Sporosarcina thermotolerans]MDW0115372.1 GNAT family N-acetyltransferase [Sporosarcina thermotolerans]WHT47285.1 GNAT family N-acetyltransferase [Sporosarcina thermotolerans]
MDIKIKFRHDIKLRPITMEDFSCVAKWSKDNVFCIANGWDLNRDEQELFNWWGRCVNNDSEGFFRIGIELESKLIGYADLACINGNSAEIGIAIGDSTLWGKGIGSDSCKLLMNYAFKHFGITIFNAETHETNLRSRKMLESIGFQEASRIGTEEYLGTDSKLIQYKFIFN